MPLNTGTYISGVAHAVLILWALIGGFFLSADDPLPVSTTEVSLLSSEEFAALSLPERSPEVVTDTPTTNVAPEPDAEPAAPLPEEAPQAAAPETPPEEIQPEQAPAPQQPPEAPPVPEEAPVDETPTPAEAPRVAPEPAAAPAPDTEIAPTVTPEVSPDDTAETVAEEAAATAPEEATTEIVTEAEKPATAAPTVSRMPTARPPRPVQAAETPPPEPDPQTDDAVADALAAAVADENASRPVASGPPLSAGEKDALRVAVQNCWNVGSLSSEALSTTVVVAVSMSRDAKPDVGSIKMLSSSGGSDAAARQAYEAARRAIIRCGANGYNLPSDKYAQWQDIEMTFNPERMRIK